MSVCAAQASGVFGIMLLLEVSNSPLAARKFVKGPVVFEKRWDWLVARRGDKFLEAEGLTLASECLSALAIKALACIW